MSGHDLDPPSADGAHSRVAGALVDALDAPVPPGMLAAVQRRATRRHRRRAAAVGAGVSAALAAAVLAGPAVVPVLDRERSVAAPSPAPRPPDRGAPAPGPQDDASSPLLTQRQVESVAPGADLAVRVSGQTPFPPIPDPGPSGGWCGGTMLAGVETPPERWRALWTQPTSDAPLTRRSVAERLFRWQGEGAAGSALAYVEATAGSPTRCDPDAEPMPGPVRQVLPVTVAGAPGAVAAVSAAEGPETPWQVRVLAPVGDRGVVVDLDVVTVAGTARGALDLVVPLVAAAVQRAGAWSEQAPATVTIDDDDGRLGLGVDDRPLVLTDPDLARLEPGARVSTTVRREEPGQASARGGWCNNADLGVGPLVDLWTQSAMVARSPTAVDGSWLMDQKVLRWERPADVSVALEAWGASTTDCVTGGPDHGGVQLVNTFQRRYAVVEAPAELGPGALVAVAPPGEEALGYLVNAAVPTGGSTLSAALVRVEATSSQDALRRATPALLAAADAAGWAP